MAQILLVEDDSQMVRLYETKLVKEGYDVIVALNGRDGLAIALTNKPDLIILDILMPQMDGERMLRELRNDDWGKDVPVIVLTNVSELKDSMTRVRANEYILKTATDMEHLMALVDRYVSA